MTYLNLLCLYLATCEVDVENGTHVGRFVVEHPTLLNLGFEWQIRGDANRNATVTVQYRNVKDIEWRPALPAGQPELGLKAEIAGVAFGSRCRQDAQSQ